MDWRYNTIWFEQIEPYKVTTIKHPDRQIPKDLGCLEYLILWHYKPPARSLVGLPMSRELRYLEYNLGSLRDLSGIGRFSNLRRLEIHRCRIDSIDGIDEVNEPLEHLHISHAPKVDLSRSHAALKNLRILRLANCAELEDLNFLMELPHLIEFRFVGTKVRSGDLSPILKHPNLRDIASQDSRSYKLKISDVQEEILRTKGSIQTEIVYKEQTVPIPMRCETFRYIY